MVEVLSSEDRRPRYQARLDDYRKMGIKYIWVIDPVSREGFDCSTENWLPTRTFVVKDSAIQMAIAELDLPGQVAIADLTFRVEFWPLKVP